MPDTSDASFLPGSWVLCWGQVIDRKAHPEDVAVEFFSHNEQFYVHLRRDRIKEADAPEFAAQCTALHETKPNKFIRCEYTDRHFGDHGRQGYAWCEEYVHGHLDGDA